MDILDILNAWLTGDWEPRTPMFGPDQLDHSDIEEIADVLRRSRDEIARLRGEYEGLVLLPGEADQ